MNKDCGIPISTLKVDGGMTASEVLLQLQADLLGITVERPRNMETTSLGAAIAAGLADGVELFDLKAVSTIQNTTKFSPACSVDGWSHWCLRNLACLPLISFSPKTATSDMDSGARLCRVAFSGWRAAARATTRLHRKAPAAARSGCWLEADSWPPALWWRWCCGRARQAMSSSSEIHSSPN